VRQSAGVPDLAARCATPVRRSVHFFARSLEVNRVAERAGFGRDDRFGRSGVHTARLSALWIVSLAHPLFDPLMADASEVNIMIDPRFLIMKPQQDSTPLAVCPTDTGT
jgi:hypothetical protein